MIITSITTTTAATKLKWTKKNGEKKLYMKIVCNKIHYWRDRKKQQQQQLWNALTANCTIQHLT